MTRKAIKDIRVLYDSNIFNIHDSIVATGRSIPVVRLLWEQVDRVRFSAPRLRNVSGFGNKKFGVFLGRKILAWSDRVLGTEEIAGLV